MNEHLPSGTLTDGRDAGLVAVDGSVVDVPPVLLGRATPESAETIRQFYLGIAELLERWVKRRDSVHTQRAYRQDVMALASFMEWQWPRDALKVLGLTVADMQAWKDDMLADGMAPKTMNRRVSSVSSFFRYLQGVAAELRLPITVPNPAHAQFIARTSTDPLKETKSLSATRARQLMGMPEGEDVVSYRDRAILKFFLYSGARLSTACRLSASDVHQDGDAATVRLREKGNRVHTIGLHFAASQAITEYLQVAGIATGPLFRPRLGPRSCELASRAMTPTGMYGVVTGYLAQLPGGCIVDDAGHSACVFTPHSLRATTATLLMDAGVDITKVQELLGHKHITTTQIYDKRRRSTAESASHDVPI